MKIAIFTSNHPRHLAMVRRLAAFADVHAVIECSTLFPGAVKDSLYNQSPLMKDYFDHVLAAERQVFGAVDFLPERVRVLNLRLGDLNALPLSVFSEALAADCAVVFGASYIKGPLAEALIEKRAVNMHMGVSPYYRGSACNFWAIHDGHPELVGATVHLLTRGLDSGDMLFHALPKPAPCDPFVLGMKAVEAAQVALCAHLQKGTLYKLPLLAQNKKKEIRYSRGADFTDEIVKQYLAAIPSAQHIGERLAAQQGKHALHNPSYL